MYGADGRGGRRLRPPGGRGGGLNCGRYPTAGVFGRIAGRAGTALTPPAGALGRGAAAIGRDPGRGRDGRGIAAVPVGAAGVGLVGTTVVFGCGGLSEGAIFSTRSLIVGGTTRPVEVTGVDVAAAAGVAGVSDSGGGTGVGGVGAGVGGAGAGVGGAGAGVGGVGAGVGGAGAGAGDVAGSGSVAVGCNGGVGSSILSDRERSLDALDGGRGGASTGGVGSGAGVSATGGSTTASPTSSVSTGGTTIGALTSRGGPSRGRIAGSGVFALFALFRPFPDEAAFCENRGPVGRFTSRSRARRSANCLATISSMVLEALFTSMPCSRLRRSMTS